jgi:hypothetical protein
VIDRAANKKAKGPAQLRAVLAATTPNSGIFGGLVLDASMRKDAARDLGGEPAVGRVLVQRRVEADGRRTREVYRRRRGREGAQDDQRQDRRRGRRHRAEQAEGWIGKEFADSITIDADHAFTRSRRR